MVKFIWLHNALKWGLMALSKCPLEGWTFGSQTAKNETPPVAPKLKVREVNQIGFQNISSHPTSVRSFSQIG